MRLGGLVVAAASDQQAIRKANSRYPALMAGGSGFSPLGEVFFRVRIRHGHEGFAVLQKGLQLGFEFAKLCRILIGEVVPLAGIFRKVVEFRCFLEIVDDEFPISVTDRG